MVGVLVECQRRVLSEGLVCHSEARIRGHENVDYDHSRSQKPNEDEGHEVIPHRSQKGDVLRNGFVS